MLILQQVTDLNFPSSTELMLGAIMGTAAGIAVLLWIDRFIYRNTRNKARHFDLKKRAAH
jgi:hypothetical protein